MKVLKTKDSLKKLIGSKTQELSSLEQELADLKNELSTLEKLDLKDRLSKRVIQFEDKIKSLIEHIEDFNSKRPRRVLELLIEEDHLSIVDLQSNKKVSTIRISGANGDQSLARCSIRSDLLLSRCYL